MAAKKKTKKNHVDQDDAESLNRALGMAMLAGSSVLKLISDVMDGIERRHRELLALRVREVELQEEQVGHVKMMADYCVWLQDHRNDVKAG